MVARSKRSNERQPFLAVPPPPRIRFRSRRLGAPRVLCVSALSFALCLSPELHSNAPNENEAHPCPFFRRPLFRYLRRRRSPPCGAGDCQTGPILERTSGFLSQSVARRRQKSAARFRRQESTRRSLDERCGIRQKLAHRRSAFSRAHSIGC